MKEMTREGRRAPTPVAPRSSRDPQGIIITMRPPSTTKTSVSLACEETI